eukprot:10749174-Alexandrium_andersonii.AAC.1
MAHERHSQAIARPREAPVREPHARLVRGFGEVARKPVARHWRGSSAACAGHPRGVWGSLARHPGALRARRQHLPGILRALH